MHVKEGIIPTVVGTAVTATGLALKDTLPKSYSSGIIGFGLAHVVLGSLDLINENPEITKAKKKLTEAINNLK